MTYPGSGQVIQYFYCENWDINFLTFTCVWRCKVWNSVAMRNEIRPYMRSYQDGVNPEKVELRDGT